MRFFMITFLAADLRGNVSLMSAESTAALHDSLAGTIEIVGLVTAIHHPERIIFGDLSSPFHLVRPIEDATLLLGEDVMKYHK